MIEKRQQAYLEAMNIPVWVARNQSEVSDVQQQKHTNANQAAALPGEIVQTSKAEPISKAEPATNAASQGLKLGSGSGGVLLICAKDSNSASKLGNDIARVLPNNPVWGWPDSDDSGVSPHEAVNENLFTSVAIFGDALAQLLFDKQVPSALGSASVIVLPAMSELENNADARRKLWSELCRSGMIVS